MMTSMRRTMISKRIPKMIMTWIRILKSLKYLNPRQKAPVKRSLQKMMTLMWTMSSKTSASSVKAVVVLTMMTMIFN